MGITSETRCCRDCGKPLSVWQRGNALYCYECAEVRRQKSHRTYAKKYAREHKAELAKYQHERREWLKSHNMCIDCGSEKAVDGQTRCEACREKSRLHWRKYKQKKKA